jgi:ribosomal protein L29
MDKDTVVDVLRRLATESDEEREQLLTTVKAALFSHELRLQLKVSGEVF